MILSSVDISLIYDTTVATVTNISETDTITYITSYDETKLEFNVDSETNSFTVRALTNENAIHERIRVQASSGDYILITIHTLVNASEPSFEFLDTISKSVTINNATIEVGNKFYDTTNVYASGGFGYVDSDILPNVTTNYTVDIIKNVFDWYITGTDVDKDQEVDKTFLVLKTESYYNVTIPTTPTALFSAGKEDFINQSWFNKITNGCLAHYRPIINFDFTKLIFLLRFYTYDKTANTYSVKYYNELSSSDEITGVDTQIYYNGSNAWDICFISRTKNGHYYTTCQSTSEKVTNTARRVNTIASSSQITVAPSGHRKVNYFAKNNDMIIGHPITKTPSGLDLSYKKCSYKTLKCPDKMYEYPTLGSMSVESINRTSVEEWLKNFPFLWSTDGVIPTNVDETSTNIKYKNDLINKIIFDQIKGITNIKDVATSTDPTPKPTPDTNTYTDETPMKHVFNSSYNNNFNKMFLLNKSDVSNIADKFWGNQEDIKQNSQLMGENPLDTVISLRLYPFDLSEYSTGVALNYYCGNFEIGQYETLNTALSPVINLGSIYIPRYHNNFLDYDEYTDIELFVPFCESKVLSAREYLDSTLNFKMVIDYNTGNCLVMVYQNNILKFTCTGQCGIDIAINGRDNAQYLSNQITGWTNTINSSINTVSTASQPPSPETALNIASGVTNVFKSSFDNSHIRNSPITSGQTTQTLNLYKPLYPYIIFRYSEPLETELTNYGRTVGYACYYDSTLGTNRGFTVCNNIDISKLKCTAEEKTKILEFLTTGIIL